MSYNTSDHNVSLCINREGDDHQIYYDTHTRFYIVPNISLLTEIALKEYMYDTANDFWDFDNVTSCITISDIAMSTTDIFQQFVKLVLWLSQYGYRVVGNTCLRISNTIQYIEADDKSGLVKLYLLPDDKCTRIHIYESSQRKMVNALTNPVKENKIDTLRKSNNLYKILTLVLFGTCVLLIINH